jgi:DNA invertase Pin-like site-specific DNA recombinase
VTIQERLWQAHADRERAEADTINVVYDAYAGGMSILGISRQVGLARQTVYNIINRLAEVKGLD